MFQVCTKAADQVMGLIIFQYCILALTLVYNYKKPHMIPPVPI